MRVSVIQLSSTLDLDRNLRAAEALVASSVSAGARLVILPEVFNRRGASAQIREHAEPLDGPSMQWAADLAQKHAIWFLPGSFAEHVSDSQMHNTSVLFDPQGRQAAVYRKIHLFDIDIPGAAARESDHVQPGEQIVTAPIDDLTLGMTVCYDLRFPELYRRLTNKGAKIITVPSAFTERTGRDHWEVLLRARAIENQVYILAPNQYGATPGTPTSYGNSMIVDPWGTVVARAADRETFILADLDFDYQTQIRQKLPSLQHQRPELYHAEER